MQKISIIFRLQSVKGKTILLFFAFIFWLFPSLARAQISSDSTVGTQVNQSGNVWSITGGTAAGTNLFHSFEEFSVPTNMEAFFNNTGNLSNIDNIISRVTGGSISNINGLIRENFGANLFLLNPQGIIFGAGASLNIGGSFIASSADSIIFSDGTVFNATNPNTPPLLTINVPFGLQYGSNPGNITVTGAGNNFNTLPLNRENRPVGLGVSPGNTLALLGGNLDISGGNLTAPSGRIELWSVSNGILSVGSSNGQAIVEALEGTLDYGEITLSNAASVDVSSNGGGEIQVRGRRVTLSDGSVILADTLGNGNGGTITVNASELIELIGTTDNGEVSSGFFANVDPGATGDGGNLNIESDRLEVRDGGNILAGTFGEGRAGTLTVTANDVELMGTAPNSNPSALFTLVFPGATGDGGILKLETERLLLTDGAILSASSFGQGDGGTATVKATDIEIRGLAATNGAPSGFFARVLFGAEGNGGNFTVETENLLVSDRGQIVADTFSSGNAGFLTIETESLLVTNEGQILTVTVGSGNAGNLTVETESLLVTGGGQIGTATAGSGNGGELIVRASDSVELSGASSFGASGLFASAIIGTGDGGNIAIATDNLIVRDEATISVSNFPSLNPDPNLFGNGAAGNLNIEAGSIFLENQAILTAASNAGEQGNITLTSESILLRQNSLITTNAQGSATGGNINIDTDTLTALENSDITANAVANFGGRVIINAQGIFGTEFRSLLTGESDITASSDLGFEFSGEVQLNTPEVEPNSGLVPLSSEVVDPNIQIATGCSVAKENEFVVSGRGGLPENPTKTIRSRTVWRDLRFPAASRRLQQANSETTLPVISPPSQIIEATGWIVGPNGNIILTADTPNVTSHSEGITNPDCRNSKQ